MHKHVGTLTRLVTLIGLVWSGCSDEDHSSQDVVAATADPNANFTSYHTFALAQSNDVAAIPDNVETNLDIVNHAMVNELQKRGLQQVDATENPDVVAFNLATTDTQGTYYWDCVEGYWWGYWDMEWTPCAWLEPQYTQYTAGTIALGLADPAQRRIVFGGLIRGIADDSGDVQDRIDDDVAAVFASYPVAQTGTPAPADNTPITITGSPIGY